ncbi:hypothetical protein RBSWK_04601 [Rhodopirellula baltica SWK14]|uniref:Uncharacterized protein n=1 Tax=Rhodopirellula baltica SWK14 TaxID=993516 RepID=L7CBV6_RHOBT|nr:hypothetical protein RBSWK_04601 [Rhodopirellula baltica SWK14]
MDAARLVSRRVVRLNGDEANLAPDGLIGCSNALNAPHHPFVRTVKTGPS